MPRMQAAAGPGTWAILLPLREWEAPVILGMQWGAALLRDGDRYGDFESPAFRAAFAFYLDLFHRGLAPVGDTAVANIYQDFARGTFSVYLTGPWNLGEFARRLPAALAERWSTTPLPAPDGTAPGTSLAGGSSLVVARTSPRKDDAWALVEYLAEPAQQVRFYRLTGDLPARRSAWEAAGLPADARAGLLAAVATRAADPQDPRVGAHRERDRAVRGGGHPRRDGHRRRARGARPGRRPGAGEAPLAARAARAVRCSGSA